MLTLLVMFLVLVLVMSLVMRAVAGAASRSAERQRQAMEEAQRAAEEERRRRGDAGGPEEELNPFALMPFGGLLEALMGGMGTRSYRFDERTGQWVEMTDEEPEQILEPEREPQPDGAAPARRKRPRPQPKRQSSSMGPFGMMGGMMGGGGDGSGEFTVQHPDELTTFEDVGGMDELKQELRDTVGLLLEHPDDAERYGIEWNGILLHGPPGVGKTFMARAIAGEYGMNLIHVSTGDLVASLVGGSARNIEKAFDTAARNLPCLLFFDEFDSVAQRRDNTPDQESRRTVNQLLTSLEAWRGERRLLVMAATNSIEHLDPAVVRPGRFDRHIRIDLPDAEARRAIFETELDERPVQPGIDLEELVRRTEGMTPAAISKIVDTAALEVFREATQTGRELLLDTEHLLAAIERYGGQDRPTVEHWTWDSLILDPQIKAQLQQLQAVIEDPESARRFGVDPPTGLLLAGPPGTGKTTVAKVLAAQARCSFYPLSGADVISKWVGESERNIRQVFERARENRPSIVFIDEIDAIAGRRGASIGVHDSHVNQLLAEIDGVGGQRGVFVIGATNRADQLDPALLRGGRLSRTIVLGLPDEAGRLAMLRLHTARMPTVAVRLEELARDSEGLSPADLKSLAQEAALAAMARGDGGASPAVTHEDFEEALRRLRAGRVTAGVEA
ncbi:MAG TPA: AAA family ATPase [Gaiellaceae bacterium]|nr:AAA family ATPase [Gaiellaceae bacterium]